MEDLYQITEVELYDNVYGEQFASEDISEKLIIDSFFYDTMIKASNVVKNKLLKEYLKLATNRELTDCKDGWIYFDFYGQLLLAVKTLILEPRECNKNEVM
jgi:hypothetical protein